MLTAYFDSQNDLLKYMNGLVTGDDYQYQPVLTAIAAAQSLYID